MDQRWHPPPRRIAVFRALKLGDMLCAMPALRAVRSRFQEAEIVLVGLPWAREFVERYPHLLDGFREFPGFPGLPEQQPAEDRLPTFFQGVRAERFDLAVQLHGSGAISNQVTARFGARTMIGFHEPEQECPDRLNFLAYPRRGLEIRRLLALLEHVGIPSRGERLEFPVRDGERRDARAILGELGLRSGGYICLHGGASAPERRWPAERFAAAADALADEGLAVLLTGTAGEAELTRAISQAMRATAFDMAGRTPLGTLAALLETSRLLVCNDTGVSHLADALRVPSVVVSTEDNPDRWAPPDRSLHRVLCRDSGVAVEEVVAESRQLLHNSASLSISRRTSAGEAGAPVGREQAAVEARRS